MNMTNCTAGSENANPPALRRSGADRKVFSYRKTVSVRPFPRLTFIGACLAAAALSLGFSAPAHADGPVFVSNIGEDSDNVFNLHDLDIAQGFVAGSADVPGSIQVDIAAAVDTDTSTVTVQLFSATAGGQPNASVCTLNIPNPWGGSGIRRFGAEGRSCPTLTAGATYFVYIHYTKTTNSGLAVQVTDSTSENASTPGWSIDDNYYWRNKSGGNWTLSITDRAVKITVRAVNAVPTSSDNTASTDEDTAYTFTVADFNYSDANSDELNHVKITSLPATGTLSLDGAAVTTNQPVSKADIDGGKLKYNPPLNGNGVALASFKFKVNDGVADSAEHTITVDVNAVNDAPAFPSGEDGERGVAENTAAGTNVGAPVAATDHDNDPLTYTLTGTDALSFAIDSAGQITVGPGTNLDHETQNSYSVTVGVSDLKDADGNADTAVDTSIDVTIRVADENDAPAASDNTASTDEDTAYTFTVADFNYSDADSDELNHVKITSLPDPGRLSLDDAQGMPDVIAIASDTNPVEVTAAELGDGKLKYNPPVNPSGNAFATAFGFRVNDGTVDSALATLAIGVTPDPLSVRFGSAAYEADEGGGGIAVEVKLNQNAIVEMKIPISVTPRGRTVPADYAVEGLDDDGKLVFEVGDATRSFTIKATEQAERDDNFHDVKVALSFSDLPQGVTEGAPATATLTIVDAEGTVVHARFSRLNEEILSKHALTVADVTNRAIGARMADPCVAKSAAYKLAGGSTLLDTLRSNALAIKNGTLTVDNVLAGSSFLLPLATVDNDRTGGAGWPVVWGRGDRHRLESTNSALAWDGAVLTGQLGIDGCPRKDLMTGLTLSRSVGAFDYTDGTGQAPVSGDYESRMTSVHPYLGWTSPQGLGLWATVGYGWGKIEIDDKQVRRSDPGNPISRSNTTLKTAAAGVRGSLITDGSLIAGGTTKLMLKGEASWSQVKVKGNDELIEKQTVNANRLRLALEGSHEQVLASGRSLTPSLELGLRRDWGDGITGNGIEIGSSLRYRDPAMGLTVEGNGRVLAGQSDYREWSLGGSVRLDPDGGGRGLSFSLVPTWGETASGVERMWDHDVAELATDDRAANDNVPQMRLDSELGYGFGALGGHGLLTPYGGFSLAGEGSQRYRIGGRFKIGSSLNLSLEGERRELADDAAAEHGAMLRMEASW